MIILRQVASSGGMVVMIVLKSAIPVHFLPSVPFPNCSGYCVSRFATPMAFPTFKMIMVYDSVCGMAQMNPVTATIRTGRTF